MQKLQQPLLVVILGPTASGKTSLSLQLAEHFSGEIVSCDSVAVYREMEIGTAKPTLGRTPADSASHDRCRGYLRSVHGWRL